MERHDRIKLYWDVFAPKNGERVLFLVDVPHDNPMDSPTWAERRKMALEWADDFRELGTDVSLITYKATGRNGAPIPQEVLDAAGKSDLVIAMTEFSASSSLIPICKAEGARTRCASMPGVTRAMEETAMSADYSRVKKYAEAIDKMLDDTIGAEIEFSTGDRLYLDLRFRTATILDSGECTTAGQAINFPSGEGYRAPYDPTPEEIEKHGKSRTKGTLPVSYGEETVKYAIDENKIVDIMGEGKKAGAMRAFFSENGTRRNIAELGIGCNPKAVVTGNTLEDEKVGLAELENGKVEFIGLHIAYGHSAHIGGKTESDVHEDTVYANVKECPIGIRKFNLVGADGSRTELIGDSKPQYDLLK